MCGDDSFSTLPLRVPTLQLVARSYHAVTKVAIFTRRELFPRHLRRHVVEFKYEGQWVGAGGGKKVNIGV